MKQYDTPNLADPVTAESVPRCIQCGDERRARYLHWCLENVPATEVSVRRKFRKLRDEPASEEAGDT